MAFARWDDDCDVHVYLGTAKGPHGWPVDEYVTMILNPHKGHRTDIPTYLAGAIFRHRKLDEVVTNLYKLAREGIKVPSRVFDRIEKEMGK